MLNKRVCKRCIITRYCGYKWSKYENDLWKDGKVMCMHDFESFARKTSKSPPKDCPFLLEHIVNKGISG